MWLFEPGEEAAAKEHLAQPLADWLRADRTPNGSLRQTFPSDLKAPGRKIPPAVIPESVFRDLPATALIGMEWRIVGEEHQ
jgi:hypothetical protein